MERSLTHIQTDPPMANFSSITVNGQPVPWIWHGLHFDSVQSWFIFKERWEGSVLSRSVWAVSQSAGRKAPINNSEFVREVVARSLCLESGREIHLKVK